MTPSPNVVDPTISPPVSDSVGERKEVYFKGYFYDVTEWIRRHPGGKIIEFYTKKGGKSAQQWIR